MLLSLRKNGLTSLFKEVRVFQGAPPPPQPFFLPRGHFAGGGEVIF